MLKKTIRLALLAGTTMATTLPGFAELSLNITGNTIMNAYYVHNSDNADVTKNFHLANDSSDLYFIIKGKTASGLEYGYRVGMQTYSGSSPFIQKNYVELNGNFGTVQVGNVVGPEDSMISDAGSIVGGTGAFDGGFSSVVNLPAFTMYGNDNIGDTGYATKIAYYTPTFSNFRFGFAYTPNTSHSGDAKLNKSTLNSDSRAPGNRGFLPKKDHLPYDLNNCAFGLSYKKEQNGWAVDLNGAYITGDAYYPAFSGTLTVPARRTKARKTSAYQIGTVIGYTRQNGHLVQVGAGYLDNGKSRLQKDNTSIYANNSSLTPLMFGDLYQGNSGKAYNAGLAYLMGIYKFAVSYQDAKRKTDAANHTRLKVASLTADVVPMSGLKLYTEATYMRARSNDPAVKTARSISASTVPNGHLVKDNNATVVVVGTKVSF